MTAASPTFPVLEDSSWYSQSTQAQVVASSFLSYLDPRAFPSDSFNMAVKAAKALVNAGSVTRRTLDIFSLAIFLTGVSGRNHYINYGRKEYKRS